MTGCTIHAACEVRESKDYCMKREVWCRGAQSSVSVDEHWQVQVARQSTLGIKSTVQIQTFSFSTRHK